jgi:hypothetical protein
MGGAICKTCGSSTDQHRPSVFDKNGIGHPGHKMDNPGLSSYSENYYVMLESDTQTKPLKSYDKHWEEKSKPLPDYSDQPTGIACPKCKEELHADFAMVLTSNPPKRNAWCVNEECAWRGYL